MKTSRPLRAGRTDYDTIMPARQISILDFDPEKSPNELYSTHHLRNDKTGDIYAGNFALSVLNLRQIDQATDEDKKWRIDQWARLFKADTWEELRMTASNDVEMTNVASTLLIKNQDEYARAWAVSREMALFDERRHRASEKKALEDLAKAEKKIVEIQAEADQHAAESSRLRAILIANGIDPDA